MFDFGGHTTNSCLGWGCILTPHMLSVLVEDRILATHHAGFLSSRVRSLSSMVCCVFVQCPPRRCILSRADLPWSASILGVHSIHCKQGLCVSGIWPHTAFDCLIQGRWGLLFLQPFIRHHFFWSRNFGGMVPLDFWHSIIRGNVVTPTHALPEDGLAFSQSMMMC